MTKQLFTLALISAAGIAIAFPESAFANHKNPTRCGVKCFMRMGYTRTQAEQLKSLGATRPLIKPVSGHTSGTTGTAVGPALPGSSGGSYYGPNSGLTPTTYAP